MTDTVSEPGHWPLCACGRRLHYTDLQQQRYVEQMIRQTGSADLKVVTSEGTWLVPRHFIALHGIKAVELPELARRYGFIRTDVP